MEENNNFQDYETANTNTAEQPGALTKILKIFYEPSAVFPALKGKMAWLVPFIILVIIGGTLGFFVRPIMVESQKKAVYENMEQYRDQIPAERYNEIMSTIDQKFAEAEKNELEWYYIPL
ncbi:MAG: hypothetical protein ABIJ45_01160, partial [Candidatus Zixiibacteriota bacterium]